MWRVLVDAAKRGAVEAGYEIITRQPGRGLSNVWDLKKGGKTQAASFRTTRDRWIAFPPLEGGKKWKTLDDVELVVVATVDSKENPKNAQVYVLPASDVRDRFVASRAARIKNGHTVRDDFGMWVNLDADHRDTASAVGSGIVQKYSPVATYVLDVLFQEMTSVHSDDGDTAITEPDDEKAQLVTISDVMTWARERVADIAGVRVEAVKLDLKVEY